MTTATLTMKRPSLRDFQIFRDAEILGLTHAEIALHSTRLTRRRVSQIIARVRRWLSLHPCDDPRLASELQRKQLARHVERLHLENIMTKARDELVYGKKELTTTREKDDGTKIVTTRQLGFNVQVLKVYLKSVEALAKLQQQPDVNLPLPEECEFPWLEGAINEVYDKWSDKIWSGQLKPKAIAEMIDDIVAAALRAAATQARASAGAATPLPVGESAKSSSPGEGVTTLARSASEGKPRCDPNDADVRRGSPDPAETTDRRSPEPQPDPLSADVARSETGHNFDPADSTVDLGPGTLDHSATASHTSLAEAPASMHDPRTSAAATASSTTTSALTSPPEPAPAEPLSLSKNEKREALPAPASRPPSPCPPVPMPPCPLATPAPRTIYL